MYRLPLFDHRVLDLTEGTAGFAGRLLGDMGAEVIKLEPPAGDPLRGSPLFETLNANKYSCVLDPSVSDSLVRLAELSVIAIATHGAIDHQQLRAANESLIVVLLPADAGPIAGIAAAGAVGLALWDQRRTGRGGLIEIGSEAATSMTTAPSAPELEPVSTLNGPIELHASAWRLSETPPHIRLPAPALGEHDAYVFGRLLGN